MKCSKCGNESGNTGRFFVRCGSPLAAAPQPVAQPASTYQQSAAQTKQTMNEFFPCGLFQPPGVQVFGVTDNAVVYGNETYPFEKIDGIYRQTDSTGVTNGVYQMKVYGRMILLVYKHADRERALRALAYAQQQVAQAHGQQIFEESKEGLLYDLEGVRGRHIQIYEDRVVLSVKATFGSFITGNISDGEKTIYFSDCIGIQFKESGLQIGYLQFETAGRIMNNSVSNFFNENTFTWDTTVQTNEYMHKVAAYVKERISFYKQQKNAPAQPAVSGADEIRKYKELLDMGIITQEEFDKKKKQILGF